MATRALARGHAVHVHDLDESLVAALVDKGATAAADAAEATAGVEIVSVCVPAASHVAAVLDAMGASLRPGVTVLVHTTIGPDEARSLRDEAAASGAALHDVSIAGGAEGAEHGDVALLVGGLGDVSPAVRSLLDDYADTVVDAGPVGAGAATKLAMNLMTYSQIGAVFVGHGIVTAEGGNPDGLYEALRSIRMLGSIADRYTINLTLTEADREPFQDFLRVQAANAQKDLRLAAGVPGSDDKSIAWVGALQAAMPMFYGATGELEDRA